MTTPRSRIKKPCIYIPLCFYFIEHIAIFLYDPWSFTFHYASTLSKFKTSGRRELMNLHSTMLLLYRRRRVLRKCLRRIYIPLCFYFILQALPYMSLTTWIYIPLCFYFIKKTGLIFPSGITNLHSTMLLLYRFSPRAERILWPTFTFHYASTLSRLGDRLRNSVCAIYIPLCFYFIGSMLKLQRSSMLNLHSTMLLLYLGSKSRSL